MPLPGHGAMRLTTSRYYTPSGRSIQAEGIEPDIVVEAAKIVPIKQSMRSEDDLKGRLDNPDEALKSIKERSEGANAEGEASSAELTDEERAQQDLQLQRALDLLRGIGVYKGLAAAAS